MDAIIEVDPATLYATVGMRSGCSPWKLQQQIIRYGASKTGMIPVTLEEDCNGRLRIIDGMTRATRMAKLAPGTTIPAKVTERRATPFGPARNVTIAQLI